jgi:hypothetical protein
LHIDSSVFFESERLSCGGFGGESGPDCRRCGSPLVGVASRPAAAGCSAGSTTSTILS